ncbi:MAG TPA: hypothetical protein VE152_09860 [Acidimicrobiales bacterium]|nr:hypothetical protein [Acidimicrobiales bacterium]
MRPGLHQGVEYALAFLLATTAIHVGGSMELVLLAGAGAVALLGAVTDGPLAAMRVLRPSAHRVLDPVVGTGLALSPLITLSHLSAVGVLLAEGAAAVLWRLAMLGHRPVRGGTGRSPSPVPAAAAAGTLAARAAGKLPIAVALAQEGEDPARSRDQAPRTPGAGTPDQSGVAGGPDHPPPSPTNPTDAPIADGAGSQTEPDPPEGKDPGTGAGAGLARALGRAAGRSRDQAMRRTDQALTRGGRGLGRRLGRRHHR